MIRIRARIKARIRAMTRESARVMTRISKVGGSTSIKKEQLRIKMRQIEIHMSWLIK
jgi:hypothetical protein